MYKNRFVCPVPSWLRGKLLEYNRLYAFPVIPESLQNAEFQILDSGAYGQIHFADKLNIRKIFLKRYMTYTQLIGYII